MAAAQTNAPIPITSRRRLHAVPQTKEYEIERGDETVVLLGYKNASCPISVSIEVQAAVDDYVAATSTLMQTIKMPDGTQQQRLKPGTRTVDLTAPALRRRQAMLCAVLRGLTEGEAEVMAADDGEGESILIELGWWKAPDAEADEADDDPEATGEATSISDGSSPRSSDAIQEPIS
jgi:hypothetical protein